MVAVNAHTKVNDSSKTDRLAAARIDRPFSVKRTPADTFGKAAAKVFGRRSELLRKLAQ